jgi:FkbM family methyltransferase
MNNYISGLLASGRLIEGVPSDKTLVGKLIRFPLRLIPQRLVIPILQGKLRGKKWIIGSSVHLCWLGIYEYKKQAIFSELVAEGSIVFDIGAHVGFYTLLSSELVGSKGKVFAFEPVPDNIFYLKNHLQLNHIENVSIIEAAVSEHNGYMYFDEGRTSMQGYISHKGKLLVRNVSLDELHLKGDIPTPDFLKIDVEGAELLVLQGMRTILNHYHPIIFLATHGKEIHQRCVNFLKSCDYKIKAIDDKSITHSEEIIAYR